MSNKKFKSDSPDPELSKIQKGIVDRLRIVFSAKKDDDLSKPLKVNVAAISNYRNGRRKIPITLLVDIAKNKRTDINWLLTGIEDTSQNILILDNDPQIQKLLESAKKVLKSGNEFASEALQRNITYFEMAVDAEKAAIEAKKAAAESENEKRQIKEEMEAMKIRLQAIEKSILNDRRKENRRHDIDSKTLIEKIGERRKIKDRRLGK